VTTVSFQGKTHGGSANLISSLLDHRCFIGTLLSGGGLDFSLFCRNCFLFPLFLSCSFFFSLFCSGYPFRLCAPS